MRSALSIFIGIYIFFSICSLWIGILSADSLLGACQKHPTIIGKYTGFAFTLDLGCKLGKRVEE